MTRVLVVGARAPSPRALALADLVEVRLDLGGDAHVAAVRSASSAHDVPLLVTLRSVREGGRFAGEPEEAAPRLAAAATRLGAAWIDAEADVVSPLAARVPVGVRVLGSVHGPAGTLPPRAGVHAWKVARPVASEDDLRAALDEARALAQAHAAGRAPPATVVPYAPAGAALNATPGLASARVVCAAAASGAGATPFLFGRDEADDDPALAGVPPLAHLVDEGRHGEVSGRARLFVLLGTPPTRSPSPRMHNAVFRALGVDAVYLPATDLPPRALTGAAIAGAGVTTPYKEAARAVCAEVDPLAMRAGAVNTLVRREGGGWFGRNTDALGVRDVLSRRGFAPAAAGAGAGALVVGGGGYARAAAVALLDLGCRVRLVGGARAAATASALRVEHAGEEVRRRDGDRVIVNATPLGADGVLPPALAALLEGAPADLVVLDAPYAAGGGAAAWARAARGQGIDAVDGGELLLAQAVAQAEAFVGRTLEARAIGPVLLDALTAPPSLVLVGPRGAGKTTVGRLVAARLGRPFVDTDDQLARRAGRPAGRVLAGEGEAAFRRREASCVAQAMARRAAVVALGGGGIPSADAAASMRTRAFVVRLSVSPATAVERTAREGGLRPPLRPGLDPVAEASSVAAEREPIYRAAAHASVPTDGRSPEDVARAVIGCVRESGGDRLFGRP